MRNPFYQKRIPTMLALILVVAGILTTTYLVQRSTTYLGHAAPDPSPHNVQIVNISDSSLTITFETVEKTVAAVSIQGRTNELVFDDRSNNDSSKTYYSHIFTLKKLSPNTAYSFTLVSDGQTYKNNAKPYTAKTARVLTSSPQTEKLTIQGTVILPDGEKGKDTIITAQLGDSQLLAGITNDNGEYTIIPSFVLDSSLTKYLSASTSANITLNAYHQDMHSRVTVLTKNSASVPIITLSKNYNFTVPVQVSSTFNATPEASFQVSEVNNSSSVQILSPADGGMLIDQQPLFRGSAAPLETVTLTISAVTPIHTTVTTDAQGNWSFRPSKPLNQGSHTITLSGRDTSDILETVTNSFSIFASGSQVADSATPSATPTLEPTATPTVPPITQTPTPTIVPTATPTPTQEVTVSPTLVPTITISPTPTSISVTATPTVRPTLAPTGSNSYLILTFAAVAFIFAGATILFLL